MGRKAKKITVTRATDRIGEIDAQIAELETEREKLRERLATSGWGVVEGHHFRSRIEEYDHTAVSWKGIALALKPSPRRLKALRKRFTTRTPTVRVVVEPFEDY